MFSQKVALAGMPAEENSVPEEIRWMSQHAPVFQMKGDDMKVILTPKDFTATLLVGICEARLERQSVWNLTLRWISNLRNCVFLFYSRRKQVDQRRE